MIEHRAQAFGIVVDARIERGRTYRHALRQTIANERFDRIVIGASAHGEVGFDPDDVAWLLANAPGEIVVLRPSQEGQIGPPPPRRRRRTRAGSLRARAPQLAVALPAREQRSGGDQTAQPDHPGLGRLLPDTGIRRSIGKLDQHLWTLTYKWAIFSHANKPTDWVVHRLLRHVQQGQARPVGVRRPRKRRLHAPLRLDQHRPTRGRQARGVPRRPRACRLLGLATAQSAPADQPHRPATPQGRGRPMRDLRGNAPARRGPATNPTSMGNVAGHHPEDDRRRLGQRHVGQG